ncbi:hypothetical protein I3760_16G000200 [Carya illinoinensis]|nr:hypothetical protein I3760_16G000200 [Carya illinoinensis]
MQKSASLSRHSNSVNTPSSLRLITPQQSLRRLGLCSQIATGGQHSSPIVFPEKRNKAKASTRRSSEVSAGGTAPAAPADDPDKAKTFEHRIDIGGPAAAGGDEKSDLLGCAVFSGKLVWDKRKTSSENTTHAQQTSTTDITSQEAVDAKLTSRALVWSSHILNLDDVVSVSYNVGLRHFTVHSYPLKKGSCGLSCLIKSRRSRKDFRFFAPTMEEAVGWVAGFADQQCFVNCLPHPLVSSKKQASSELLPPDTPPELLFKCKNPPKMLVILNPRSGRGRSSKVFHGIVEPIFKLAGFKLEVKETTSAGHARKLASSVDIDTCPDGIICVGGDGIINEVLNGLLTRDNQKEGISIPIGIIPAGSDNSLVWTVLGVRDPISAAMAIVKGGLTATDVFAIEWIQRGVIHFGMTVSYFGFVSDVLELSEKYQKRFGPLRYFVAGFLKFLCLPKYNYEVEYLPASKEDVDGNFTTEREVVDISELYTDIMRRSSKDGIPRASSLSSIDSIMTPSRMSGGDLDTTCSKNPIELPGPSDDVETGMRREVIPRCEDKWVVTKGQYLGILVCNHACRTVQSSQVVAPKAEHDDNTMDLLLVHGSGRLRLLRFFILLQLGRHLSLPYVEYVKVKSVKIKPGKHTHNGCGIDGELFALNEQVISSLLPEQCRLIGRIQSHHV